MMTCIYKVLQRLDEIRQFCNVKMKTKLQSYVIWNEYVQTPIHARLFFLNLQ